MQSFVLVAVALLAEIVAAAPAVIAEPALPTNGESPRCVSEHQTDHGKSSADPYVATPKPDCTIM
jgi:hypothetical protein